MPRRKISDIPRLSVGFWRTLCFDMIRKIKERTERGQGVDGAFKPYSQTYSKRKGSDKFRRQASTQTSPPDLTLTGDMMRDLKFLEATDKHGVIGWPAWGERMRFNADQGRAIVTATKAATKEEEAFIMRQIKSTTDRNSREASEVRVHKIGKR